MALIRGDRTLQTISQDVRMRDLQKEIVWIQPNRAPFTTFLNRIGSKPSIAMKYEHAEYDFILPQATMTNSSTASTATTLQLIAGHAARLKLNSQLWNSATDETMLVTAIDVTTDIVTVVRGFGDNGAVAATIAASQVLSQTAEGNEEGIDYGTAISNEVSLTYNYCQEFETPVSMSNLQQTVVDYTQPDWPEQIRRAAADHKEKMERAYIFGRRKQVTAGPVAGHYMFFTGGMWEYIDSSNKKSVSGILTERTVNDWLRGLMVYGDPSKKLIVTSPFGWQILSALSKGYQRVPQSEQTLGMTIDKMELCGRVFPVVESQMFDRISYNTVIFAFDMSCVRQRVLAGNGKNWGAKWITNVQNPSFKGQKDVIYGVTGLQRMNPKAHGVLYGWNG